MARKLWSYQKKSRYKSIDNWLDSIYRKHQAKIDAGLEQPTNPKKTKEDAFKQLVKEYHDEGYSWSKSVKIYEKSAKFTDVAERLQTNAYHALTDDQEAYRQFRELTKEHGRYTKIDWKKIEWDPTESSYIYDSKIRISFANSPKEVIVEEIDEE